MATIYFITQFCVASIRGSYYLRAVFIKLGMEDEEIQYLQEGGVVADARESTRRDTATLATVTDTKLEESRPLC